MKTLTLTLITAAISSAALAQQAAAPAAPPADVKIETINVAPGIYMLMGKGGNIGLTVGVDGAAIIDSQFDDMAPKIRSAVAMLSDKPVEVPDQHAPARRSHRWQRRLRQDGRGHHRARERAQVLGTAQVNPSTNAAIPARAREALPVITFADSATLHFNDDDLEFTHLPNAHTATDIAVRFTKANVLHMGDTFTGGFPFIDGNTGGTFDGLILAHEKVLATVDDNTKIIRGHGPLGNKAELQAYHDMLVVVRDRVAKLVKAGKSQEDVVAARPTKEFEEKYGGANFNAAQWIGRAYVDQKTALEKRKKK